MAARVLVSIDGLSREQWLELRRRGIGGSDASVVCGVNKYKSPIELWQEKTGQTPRQEAGEAARWGTLLEPLVRNEFTERTGFKVKQVNQLLQSKDYPFMLANVDGVLKHPELGPCIFEAKTCSAYKSSEWDDGAVPYEYILQIQHYMSVTGFNGTYIAVLIGGNEFKWTFIERDEILITMLIRREADFWTRVVDGVVPDADGSDACVRYLGQRYPNCIPMSKVVLPSTASDLIQQYNEANEQVDIHTERKQRAANLLKQMLGNNEIGTVGDGFVKWQTIQQERFDSKLFQAEQPDVYAKYVTKSSYRRLTIKSQSQTDECGTNPESLRKAG